jgi:hypothetical protein
MKVKILVILTILLVSCAISKKFVKVKYQPSEDSIPCYMEIPKGYILTITRVTWEKEYHFTYTDNSWIYISNYESAIISNYKNIKVLGDSIFNLRFQNVELAKARNKEYGKEVIKIVPDTMELSGIDSDSLYWKDVKIGKLSIGYCGVPKKKKELFDNAIQSFKIGNDSNNVSPANKSVKSKKRVEYLDKC